MSGPAVSARPARSYKAAADILSERDPVLRQLVARAGPVRVNPPTETRFAALVRAILYQRLAGTAVRAIHGRLIASLGGEVTRKRFLSRSSQRLQAVGLSASKAASMRIGQRGIPAAAALTAVRPCRRVRRGERLRPA
jgi:3-methyladenine DNA glycosylase/8-oxoguanine DNA glycosylase